MADSSAGSVTAPWTAVLRRPARRLSRELSRRWRRAVRAELQPLVAREVEQNVGRAIRTAMPPAVQAAVTPVVEAALAPVRDTQSAHRSQTFTEGLLLGSGTRVDRTLPSERVELLSRQLSVLTGVEDLNWALVKAYRGLLDAETRGLGRIAGSTPNILGKLVGSTRLGAPAGPVLEIGTLFGLFSPLLLRQFSQRGEFRELTVIDPFAGSQLQPDTDHRADFTGTPVTQEVAVANFATLGLTPDRYRMITGLSGDAAVRAEAADRRYAVIIVDGDHSEDGVYADLRWAEHLLLPGGIAVMDDYGDRLWPGVERAVRRYLDEGGRLQLVGTAASSAFLRASVETG